MKKGKPISVNDVKSETHWCIEVLFRGYQYYRGKPNKYSNRDVKKMGKDIIDLIQKIDCDEDKRDFLMRDYGTLQKYLPYNHKLRDVLALSPICWKKS